MTASEKETEVPEPAAKDTRSLSDEENQRTEAPKEFQEGGYGWVVVAAVFFVNAHTWGLNSAFSVFLAYYIRTNLFETSDLSYAFVGGLSLAISFLVSPLSTFLAGWDKCGVRLTIFIGAVFEAASFIAASFATKFWHVVLSQGVTFGIGMGLAFVSSAPIPAQWFYKKRSLASGLATAGSGIGGLVYLLATNAMIESIGLAWTFRALGVIGFVVLAASCFFVRDRNAAVGVVNAPFNWSLFRRPAFILFQMWMVLSLIGYIILLFSLVAYGQALGLSAAEASLVGALFNLGQGFGRPLVGLSSDFVGRLNIANLGTLWCGLLCLFVWMFGARSFGGCVVFALLGGTVAGVMWPTAAPICAEVLGMALTPSALSITWLMLVIPSAAAEVIAFSLRSSGSWGYRDVQLLTAFLYIGAFVFGWILRAWKVWDLDQVQRRKELQGDSDVIDDGILTSAQLRRQPSRASTVKQKILHMRGLWEIRRV